MYSLTVTVPLRPTTATCVFGVPVPLPPITTGPVGAGGEALPVTVAAAPGVAGTRILGRGAEQEGVAIAVFQAGEAALRIRRRRRVGNVLG